MRRLGASLGTLIILSVALAAPVAAAPPDNDTYAGRTVIRALPFSEATDTTEATTDSDDVELNARCGLRATEASVWYEFTAASDQPHVIHAAGGSDYAVGLIVATGSPGSFEVLACAERAIEHFPARAGQTYAILAVDIGFDDPPFGGRLVMTVEEELPPPPPPAVDLTVDRLAQLDTQSGVATVSGTVVCNGDAANVNLVVELLQGVLLFDRTGLGFGAADCDGRLHAWTVEVVGFSGPYQVGPAYALAHASACGPPCGVDSAEQFVLVRR